MAERRNCNFCGNSIEPGTGRMYIRTDGTVFYFDRHKCFENFVNLKRIPQDTKWSSMSRTASRWKGRPRKQRAATPKVYAPKRTVGAKAREEAAAETSAEGEQTPAAAEEKPGEQVSR